MNVNENMMTFSVQKY